ncbi:B12-binding domain-containing radical SAM protein [Candidatus Pacearchaeota archaeon]|nr:B12-binding domain-containing radical SAM protein [Candidatus Pacearchaeota archaeon]
MTKAMFITKGEEHYPPMGIMQLSAAAKQNGHETCVALTSIEDVWQRIDEERPDVVAYSGSTGEHRAYFEINREVRKKHPRIKSIMGGPHATFFPEKTLSNARLNAVCIGEGDLAFSRFLDRVGEGRDFSDVNNLMTNPLQRPQLDPLVQDLDSLPFPDRGLFFDRGDAGQNPLKHFFISRGCPYSCTYCFNDSFRKMYPGERYVRRRSVDSVLEEIDEVGARWPMKFIKFYDDIFSLKVDDWLKEFADKYPKQVGLPFFALLRANLVTDEMADLLKQSGCHAISMSIEAANPRIREEILQRKMTNEQIIAAYRAFGQRGIAIQSNNILGLPTSTIEDDIATLDLNIECGKYARVMAEFGTAHPYPGTALGDYCQKHGLYDSGSGFFDMHQSYQTESPLNCFTPMEKRMQRNLTMLGPVAVRFPRLRNLIVDHLIKLPTNPVFFTAFDLNKATGYMQHIYQMERSWGDYAKVLYRSFRKNWFKRMGEKVDAK